MENAELAEPPNMLAVIARAAADPMVDVDKLERMMAMQERWEARHAEKEFNEAVARISGKVPRITKSKAVSYKEAEAFRYATYEDIDQAVRPLLIEEGMSLSYTTEMREGGGAIVTGTLSHRNGHSRSASIPVPLDTSGGKNNVQGMGSTFSYGKRYTMCMLLNIVTVGEDNDGAGAPITDEQAAWVKNELKETGADVIQFLKYMKAENVEAILTKDYEKAKTALLAKRKKQEKANANPA